MFAFVLCLCWLCLQPLLPFEKQLKAEIELREERALLRDQRWVTERAKELWNVWKRKELAREDLSQAERKVLENKTFKASNGWYSRFLTRSGLEARKVTCTKKMTIAEFRNKNATWLPRCRRHLRDQWPGLVDDNGRFRLDRLANIDEVPMQLINKFNKQVTYLCFVCVFTVLLVFFCLFCTGKETPVQKKNDDTIQKRLGKRVGRKARE